LHNIISGLIREAVHLLRLLTAESSKAAPTTTQRIAAARIPIAL
jgi:hypothetical protein